MELADRLKLIMKRHSLNNQGLAERLDVQPSGINHILNGRNNPRLDFLVKLGKVFPDVDLNWLILGFQGTERTSDNTNVNALNKSNNTNVSRENSRNNTNVSIENIGNQQEKSDESPTELLLATGGRTIRQVMLLYTDGTFETYSPPTTD